MTEMEEESTTMEVPLGLPCPAPFAINYLHKWAGQIDEYWPRRLLHIETLTSHERGENNTYGGISQPDYVVLSYTWGRFENRQAQGQLALPIKNVPWKIPVIKESHFTVDQFRKVLKRMSATGNQWAWVDIACIDQEDEATKMDEIGKQAAIFQKAQEAYVWLSHATSESLSEAADTINSVASWIAHGDWLDFSYVRPEDRIHDILKWPSWNEISRPQKLIVLKTLNEAFDVILADPWFTSLWTLQEVTMRNDAIILSDHADLVVRRWYDADQFRSVYSMVHLSKHWDTLRWELAEMLEHKDNGFRSRYIDDAGEEIQKLRKGETDEFLRSEILALANRVTATGFPDLSTDNPHVQYGTAHYRKTVNEVDRIYGIMQIYSIRVGQALRPGDRPCLEELALEFAVEVNVRSLLKGQLFVHTTPIETTPSWCITEQSAVPTTLRDCRGPLEECAAKFCAPGTLTVTGKTCRLDRLLETYDTHARQYGLDIALAPHIFLDVHVTKVVQPEAIPTLEYIKSSRLNHYSLGLKILSVFDPEELLILKLGKLQEMNVALLLRRVEPNGTRDMQSPYVRLGVCHWATHPLEAELSELESFSQEQSDLDNELLYSGAMDDLFTETSTVQVV